MRNMECELELQKIRKILTESTVDGSGVSVFSPVLKTQPPSTDTQYRPT